MSAVRRPGIAALAVGALIAGCGGKDGPTGPTLRTVEGDWEVLYVKEISRANPSVFEVVCCPGATVIESYDRDGGWSSTYDDGTGSPSTITGQVEIRGDSIYFTIVGDTTVYNASLQVGQGVMTQQHPTTWDFDDDGLDEPAIEEYRFAKQ